MTMTEEKKQEETERKEKHKARNGRKKKECDRLKLKKEQDCKRNREMKDKKASKKANKRSLASLCSQPLSSGRSARCMVWWSGWRGLGDNCNVLLYHTTELNNE